MHGAFLQPARVRVQHCALPVGTTVFAVAHTVQRHAGGYHVPTVLYAVDVGCDIGSARQLVYAYGVDLANADAAVPIGITCRLCERTTCQARARPALHEPLEVDGNVRGISFDPPVRQAGS